MTLSIEQIVFLDRISRSSDGHVDGFPARLYKGIMLDRRLNLFRMGSGYDIGGGYDGRTETDAYYFVVDAFMPFIDKLMKEREVQIELKGIYVHDKDSWDHSYASPDDSGSASIRPGHVSGNIRLKQDDSLEYELNFSPHGPGISIDSDTGSISTEEIIEAIKALQ